MQSDPTSTKLRLPNTLGAIGRDELEAALRSELPASRLPLERFIVDGGWPANAVVRVVATEGDAATLRLTLCVTFDELVTGCGCGAEERPRIADLVLTVDRATAVATIA